MQATKKIVLVGGGHVNCQVLKMVKNMIADQNLPVSLTLVSESSCSYYSGMLPGTVSNLYSEHDLKVLLSPLAKWCNADFIEQRVDKIIGNENKIYLQNGQTLEYDVLAINVGSKTKDTGNVKGVWENALTTRPINDLIPKIQEKEQELKQKGIVPVVAIIGAGAAGTELSYAFKKRWSEFFGQDIKVTLIASNSTPLHTENKHMVNQVMSHLSQKGIRVETNCKVKEVLQNGVLLHDDRFIDCDVAVWATGAEPQKVSGESDLDLLQGFYRVNNFMQSTSHPNVFAGGDCVTMENYVEHPYPTKAGVYAVRAGPIIAKNIMNFLSDDQKPLIEYVPQQGFLSLMMTADGRCIGSKHGIAFIGKWVWGLKDFIDRSFVNLFDPKILFQDYENLGTQNPIETNDTQNADFEKNMMEELKQKVAFMSAEEAGKILSCHQDEEEFHQRWQIMLRMHNNIEFTQKVIAHFNPPYFIES